MSSTTRTTDLKDGKLTKRPGIVKLLGTAALLAVAVYGAKKATAFIKAHGETFNEKEPAGTIN